MCGIMAPHSDWTALLDITTVLFLVGALVVVAMAVITQRKPRDAKAGLENGKRWEKLGMQRCQFVLPPRAMDTRRVFRAR